MVQVRSGETQGKDDGLSTKQRILDVSAQICIQIAFLYMLIIEAEEF